MFRNLSRHPKFKEALFLFTLSLLCFLASIFRCWFTDSKVYLFLNWNLFLAFIPWALTLLIKVSSHSKYRKLKTTGLLLSWLLFFPNAPYILTDLFHLSSNSSMPLWFDLILILSFAWTGLLFGLLSLGNIEAHLSYYVQKHWLPIGSTALLFLSSFGIYLGRYLRWNSWDVVQNPGGLLSDIGHRIVFPFQHPQTWGMTLFMGLFLVGVYTSLRLLKNNFSNTTLLAPQS